MSKYQKGDHVWLEDVDFNKRTYGVYEGVILEEIEPDPLDSMPQYRVQLQDGQEVEEVHEALLYASATQAEIALYLYMIKLRDGYKCDLFEHTKWVAQDWKAIDFLTDAIEAVKPED